MTPRTFSMLITAALGLCLALPAPAFSASVKEVKAELAAKKEAHKKLVEKSKALEFEVAGLKTKLIKTSDNLRATENNISSIDKKLKDLRTKKARYVESFYKDQEALGGLVTAAQRFQRTSTPQMLLQSKPIDAARASLVMKTAIPALHDQSTLIQARLDEIEKIESDIGLQLDRKSREYKKISAQEEQMNKLLEQRQEIYKQTENDRKKEEANVARLAKEAKTLEELVLKIKPKKPGTTKREPLPSNMITPVQGAVLTGFGDDDELGNKSEGITFNARAGSAVVTPLAGKVRFAGPFQKYRQILIIEHRGGYHSLIAGLGRIDTVVGASLASGEPVGTVASAKDKPQPVYYELRSNGDPVDPRKVFLAQLKTKAR